MGYVVSTVACMSRLERITTDPSVCHGQPTVRGLRYPVENLLELLASGMSIEEIIEDHPDLEREDLLAALQLGALASGSAPGGPARRCMKFVVVAQLSASVQCSMFGAYDAAASFA